MPHNRYFVPQKIEKSCSLQIEDTEFHHMTRVMRQKVGDEVELVNGEGILAIGRIQIIGKHHAEVTIQSIMLEPPPLQTLTLALAYLRPSHLEFAVEKAVELGVDEICLFDAERGEKKNLSDSQTKRLQQIVISATKQCGRLYCPKILYKTFFECLKSNALKLFGDLSPQALPPHIAAQKSSSLQIMIGPESGFTAREETLMRENSATGISLNRNILRAETAAIAAVALLKAPISGGKV